jgi:uncharacterized membrane protein
LFSAAVALALAVGLLFSAAPALAKSYTMGPVNIGAQLAKNGSMLVIEDRTFDFSGDYHFVYWDLKKKGGTSLVVNSLEEVGPSGTTSYRGTTSPEPSTSGEPGTYEITDSGDTLSVRAFFSKSDEKATFRLTYTVNGAAQRYQDVSELYWQFIGDQWSEPVSQVSIAIKPPAPLPKTDVKAWAHGPLTGTVAIAEDGTVT